MLTQDQIYQYALANHHISPVDSYDDAAEAIASAFPEDYAMIRAGYLTAAIDADTLRRRTLSALIERPQCGLPNRLFHQEAARPIWGEPCRWGLQVHLNLGGLTLAHEFIEHAIEAALESWEAVIGVGFRRIGTRTGAHIAGEVARLNRGVLGWSHLPSGGCSSFVDQRYSSAVDWDGDLLQGTIAHEIGHALGFLHSPDPKALMYAFLRRDIIRPTDVDYELAIEAGYGDPEPADPDPDPTPTPDPPRGFPERIAFWWAGGKRVDYRLLEGDET